MRQEEGPAHWQDYGSDCKSLAMTLAVARRLGHRYLLVTELKKLVEEGTSDKVGGFGFDVAGGYFVKAVKVGPEILMDVCEGNVQHYMGLSWNGFLCWYLDHIDKWKP